MLRKHIFTLLLLVIVIGACQSESGSSGEDNSNDSSAQESQSVEFNIGTAGSGGALYPMGTAMAKVITDNSDNLSASAISTGGSVDNIRQLVDGEQGIGIGSTDLADYAYNGEDLYEGNQVEDLRTLFASINQWALAITRADSGINSIDELEGGRIGVGAPGSGGENTANKILGTYGITYDDITEEFLSDGEMAEGLQDGTLDAMIITNPLKSSTLLDLSNAEEIKLLPVDNEEFYEENPYFTKANVPAETYPGQDEAVPTPINRIIYMTMNDGQLNNNQIKEMLEILWDNQEPWIESHAAVEADTSFDTALDGMTVPLHSGAVEYYEEQGVEIPNELIPPEAE
ncbi:TAXI family TRAP transporter solute-binding subunit [Salibacterium sp. K-3]